MEGESVKSFSVKVKGVAGNCNLTKKCPQTSCPERVSFSEETCILKRKVPRQMSWRVQVWSVVDRTCPLEEEINYQIYVGVCLLILELYIQTNQKSVCL